MGKFKPTTENRYGRIARRAADILEERGWVQGVEEHADGRVCLIGAIGLALSPQPQSVRLDAVHSVSDTFGIWMKDHYPDAVPGNPFTLMNVAGMPTWNDTVFKSKEEALGWLRKFADDLDPQRA